MRIGDVAEARWAALADRAVARAAIAGAEARVARTVWVEDGSEEHHLLPGWQQILGRVARRRVAGPGGDARRTGLDRDGRVVFIDGVSWDGTRVCESIAYATGQAERVVTVGDRARALEFASLDDRGRVDEVISWRPGDGPEAYREHRRCRYDRRGNLAAVVELHESGHANASRFVHGIDGRLQLVEWLNLPGEHRGPGAWESAFAAIDSPRRRSVSWDGRLRTREPDLKPGELALEGLAPPLADAILAALGRQAGHLGPLAFADVRVGIVGQLDDTNLLTVAVAGEAYRDRARTAAEDLHTVLRLAGEDAPDTVRLDVIDQCPRDVLQRIRAGLQAIATSEGGVAAYQAAASHSVRLAEALAAELAGRRWPGAGEDFLAIVRGPGDVADAGGHHSRYEPFYERTHRTLHTMRGAVGDDRVDAFIAATAPTRGRGHAATFDGAGDGDGYDDEEDFYDDDELPDEDDGDPRDLRLDAEGIVALLVDAGLPREQTERYVADAAWGIVLEPGGTGESRLGGRPTLALDVPWPVADGRPLTHLATIAAGELPDVPGRDVLPAAGWLSFFADLSEAAEFYEPVPAGPDGDGLALVVHTPASARTHTPDPPPGPPGREDFDPPVMLSERRVRPTARLQLRYVGFGSAARWYDIDAVGEHIIERLIHAVNGRGSHQLLGHPGTVQDDPREPGQTMLFHIEYDPDLEFEFLDAGSLMFFGDPDPIRAGDWSEVTVWPSSC